MTVADADTTKGTKQIIILDIAEDYFGGGSGNTEDTRKVIESGIQSLSEGNEIDNENKKIIIEQLHKPLGRNYFASALEKFSQPTQFNNWKSFCTLGEFLQHLLRAFLLEKDNNYNTLQVVLHTGRSIFSFVWFSL